MIWASATTIKPIMAYKMVFFCTRDATVVAAASDVAQATKDDHYHRNHTYNC